MTPEARSTLKAITLSKQFLISTLLISALTVSLFSFILYFEKKHSLEAGIDEKLRTAAVMAREALPDDYHDRISGPLSVSDAEYQRVVDRYNKICQQLGMEYLWSLIDIDGSILFTSATSPDKEVSNRKHAAFFERHSNPEVYTNVFSTMKPSFKDNLDKWGNIRVALIPFKDIHGRPYLFGASIRLIERDSQLHQIFMKGFILSLLIILMALIITTLQTRIILRPIVQLTETIKRITDGDSKLIAEERGTYEQIVLSQSFNRLNISLQSKITDQILAEKAMREKSEELENYFALSLDLLCIADLSGHFIRLNPEWEKVLGYSMQELKNKLFLDLVHPEDRESTLAAISKLSAQEKVLSFENRYQKKDGTYLWLEWRSIPQKEMIYAIARDITERKIAEQTLRQSEKKFRNLIWDLPVGVLLQGPNTEIILSNPNALELLGLSEDQLLGKTSFDPNWNVIHEDGSPFPGTTHPVAEAVSTQQPVHNVIMGVARPTKGDRVWLSVDAVPLLNEDGTVRQVICSFIDITQRKLSEENLRRSEEKLATLFSSMTEMVALHEIVFNESGDPVNYMITDCNNAYTQITGIPRENAIGKLATEVYQCEEPPYFKEFSTVALTGKSFEYTTFYAPMDKHFSISVVSPKINTFATITTDITGVKQVQEVITNKNKELENYLYIASHDLRSPLVNIQGFSQRLKKQTDMIKEMTNSAQLTPETRSSLEQATDVEIPKTLAFIMSSVTKMETLLKGLLQISRTGRTMMVIRQVDVDQLIRSVIANHNYQLSEIKAHVKIGKLLPCYGDDTMLNQLFSNIIGNAIKHRAPDHELTIEISSRQEMRKNIYSIRDTGLGIDPRHIERIWDVFFRVDSTMPDAGDGLGLSIVKRITEKHRGKVWVESELNRGSTFHIELPNILFSE